MSLYFVEVPGRAFPCVSLAAEGRTRRRPGSVSGLVSSWPQPSIPTLDQMPFSGGAAGYEIPHSNTGDFITKFSSILFDLYSSF